ncbi:hypothetical protein MY3296_005053 [Beauveria thailandica]
MKPFISIVAAISVANKAHVLAAETASPCCQLLGGASALDGKVYLPSSAPYEARLDSYWSLSAALRPWCMVLPSSAEDVSVVMKILVENRCRFGIRAGGHGGFPLSNSVQDGVTIDLGHMNTTTWNPETGLASIQPGSQWHHVYETLAPHGVVVAGARVDTVGVGGFLTGGGLSFHKESHGQACDNVANFELVLASGEIVNANASSNRDLWQALKGSSGNLGLVTRFDMYGIEYADPAKPQVWGGAVVYPESLGQHLTDLMVDFTDNIHEDENSSVALAWTYNPQAEDATLISAIFANTAAKAKPAAFDGFYSADGMLRDDTRVTSMAQLVRELGITQVAGNHNAWYTGAFQNDARPMRYAVEKFSELIKELEEVAPSSTSGLNMALYFQSLSKSMTDKGIQKGGNVIALERFTDKSNGILMLVLVTVKDAEAEKVIVPRVERLMHHVDLYSASLKLKWEWRYLNYACAVQDAIASYGTKSVAKIRAAADKYDPYGVFQSLRVSGFKIPKDHSKTEL